MSKESNRERWREREGEREGGSRAHQIKHLPTYINIQTI